MNSYPCLSSPLYIRGKRYRNRMITSPVSQPFYTDGGKLSYRAHGHLVEQAEGGFAQVTIGEQPVDPELRYGKGFTIFDDELDPDMARSFSEYVHDVHCRGALASMELGHFGADVHEQQTKITRTCGPMGYVRRDGCVVEALDEVGMERLCKLYARAVQRLRFLGFDGCVVHSAHGTLLPQFISPRTNRRTDEYGGSLDNRLRFPLRVLKAVREAAGEKFIVEVRISGIEYAENGITLEDSIYYVSKMKGLVDLVHVSAGVYSTPELFIRTHPTIYLPHACNLEAAAAIKATTDIPVVLVGAMSDPDEAERILAEGKADMIAFGRQSIADPFYPRKVVENRTGEISPCVRCFNCMDISPENGLTLRCTVNPKAGKAAYEPYEYPKAEIPRKVVVIGGGPGGMKAAITAAKCGHKVVLYEKSPKLGGTLRFTDTDVYKGDLRRFRDALIGQVESLPVDVRLNTEATVEMISAETPDLLIVATGATDIRPKIPGADRHNVMTAIEAYVAPELVGNRVVIIGGGLTGCESAVSWASSGERTVTVLEMGPEIAPGNESPHKIGLMVKMHELVTAVASVKVTEIDDAGVHAVTGEGESVVYPADTVILAAGRKSTQDEARRFDGLAPMTSVIGDADRVGKVRDAVSGGYYAAVSLGYI